jgi:hypothetical protein
MGGVFQRFRDARADRVQVDISHGGKQGPLIAKRLALVPAFPESPLAAIFAIGASGDGLKDRDTHARTEIGTPMILLDVSI